jgi:hypothetical protein
VGKFAAETTVSPERSRAEIEEVLRRYGADQFMSGWSDNRATIAFRAQGRFVRFLLTLPLRTEKRFHEAERRGRTVKVTPDQATRAWEQEIRQRWRALCLVIKAKLEAVESGIEVFDEAFMAQIILPGGQTMAEAMLGQIAEAYKTGEPPKLLPMLPSP